MKFIGINCRMLRGRAEMCSLKGWRVVAYSVVRRTTKLLTNSAFTGLVVTLFHTTGDWDPHQQNKTALLEFFEDKAVLHDNSTPAYLSEVRRDIIESSRKASTFPSTQKCYK